MVVLSGLAVAKGCFLHSDTSWIFNDTTDVLAVGAQAWTNKDDTYASLPPELVGASFWPGLGHNLCPVGALNFTAPAG